MNEMLIFFKIVHLWVNNYSNKFGYTQNSSFVKLKKLFKKFVRSF